MPGSHGTKCAKCVSVETGACREATTADHFQWKLMHAGKPRQQTAATGRRVLCLVVQVELSRTNAYVAFRIDFIAFSRDSKDLLCK